VTMPAGLKVGSAHYRVKLSTSLDVYGLTDNRSSKIRVADWQPDGQLRATLLHEALHAILFCAGADKLLGLDYDTEEKLVSLLQPWLLSLLRDNHDLATYLLAP
jgi:hypothetical protein